MAKADPAFASLYQRLSVRADARGAAEHRAELLRPATGRVLEIGCGYGLNFRHYPAAVSSVVAVEPEPTLRAVATVAAQAAPVPIEIVATSATSLPLSHASVDTAVASLVLCSVDDVAETLAEVRRVLRPYGQLLFYEHVSSPKKLVRRIQHQITPYTRRYGGNCHPNRNTARAISEAGFVIENMRAFNFRPAWYAFPMAPHILGRASAQPNRLPSES